MSYTDKQQQREYQQQHYSKYKNEYDMRAKRYKARNRKFIRRYKSMCGCKFCGEKDYACLDFHHLNPDEKDIRIAQANRWCIKRLKVEMRKCIVICSNCHRKLHYYGDKWAT